MGGTKEKTEELSVSPENNQDQSPGDVFLFICYPAKGKKFKRVRA